VGIIDKTTHRLTCPQCGASETVIVLDLPDDHYLVKVVSQPGYRNSLELLSAARNYAAHESQQSKSAFKKATGQNRVGTAGSWLKRQNRFQTIADSLKAMADDIHAEAPY
jgi:acyl carrier protein phosphodiesterase